MRTIFSSPSCTAGFGKVLKHNPVSHVLGRICFDHQACNRLNLLYSYFRELDDYVDAPGRDSHDALEVIREQRDLVDKVYVTGRSQPGLPISPVLVEDRANGKRLRPAVHSMLDVFEFDSRRKGKAVPQQDLMLYSMKLAGAYTGLLLAFIEGGTRYQALGAELAHACHIIHMLRDYRQDRELGYINVPDRVGAGDQGLSCFIDKTVAHVEDLLRRGKERLATIPSLRVKLMAALYCSRYERVLVHIKSSGFPIDDHASCRHSSKTAMLLCAVCVVARHFVHRVGV